MVLSPEYAKHNEAALLLETDGYTNDAPEHLESRLVYRERDLDSSLRLLTSGTYKRYLRGVE